MEGLEHDADIAAAKARERILVEPPQVRAGHHDRAGVRPFEAGQDHQQRGLARAGRADQANRLAASYIEIDVFEDMDPGGAAAERKIDAGERDGRVAVAAVEMSFMRPDAGSCARIRAPLIWEAGPQGPAALRRLGGCWCLFSPWMAGRGERGRTDRSRSWRSAIR